MKGNRLMKQTMVIFSVCVLCGLVCISCGNLDSEAEQTSVQAAAAATEQSAEQTSDTNTAPYAAYNGYAFFENDGHIKYFIDTKDGFRLHCFFQSGSPEYEEKTYTLDISAANTSDAVLTISHITDEYGRDLSESFAHLSFTFYPDKVVMKVERKDELLAGGDSDNLLTGEYTLLPSQQSVAAPAEEESVADEPVHAAYDSGELVAMARAYYEAQSGFFAPETECTENEDGSYTIHLYEIVENEKENTWHTATSCWYTVDASGRGSDDITGAQITLPPLSLADTATYVGSPVKLRYIENGEARNEWEITDSKALTSCLEALRQLQTGRETELRATDVEEAFIFEFQDGSVWGLSFEEGDLLKDNVRYETDGYAAVKEPISNYLKEEWQ